LAVYTDSLQNGFENWSWATNNFANPSPVFSGTDSISFVPSDYGAIYFHNPTPFTLSTYTSLQFWINGALTSGESFSVLIYGTGTAPATIGTSVTLPSPLVSGTWVEQTIPITAFGEPAGTQISGFAIQFISANVAPTFYVDAVSFV